MNSRYRIGQKVIVKPLVLPSPDPRGSTLDLYAGQIATIIDYHWISPRFSEVFYVYRVKVESSGKEIVVHEDEIEEYTSYSLKAGK